MKAFKLFSIIKVSVISMIIIVFWILIITLITNKRKLFSYLSFSEYTAINVKIDYLSPIDKTIQWTQYPVIDRKHTNKILIITEARSGSTFLGDLLQQDWPTYYHFEPLIDMRAKSPRSDKSMTEEGAKLLHNLLECNFHNLSHEYLTPIFWKVSYLNWNLVMSKTIQKNNILLFNATLNQLICQRCPNRLIKTIRFGVENFLTLQQKSKTPIKLVFLVRDPRGVMSSRYRMQWCINSPNCTDVEVLCDRMRADINALILIHKWSNQSISLVRYEDLSLNPMETAQKLFAKLNLEFTEPIRMWIEEHTRIEDLLSNPHSTTRNSRSAPFKWFSRLTINEVIEVQEFCTDVMQKLGYKVINDLDYDENDTQIMDQNYSLDQILDQKFPLYYLKP